MILSQLRLLISAHLGQNGMPPRVIAPVMNILELMENELALIGYDVISPEIHKEHQRLKEAIVLWNAGDESEEEPAPISAPDPSLSRPQMFPLSTEEYEGDDPDTVHLDEDEED